MPIPLRLAYRAHPAHNPRAPLPRKTLEPADAAVLYQTRAIQSEGLWYGRKRSTRTG